MKKNNAKNFFLVAIIILFIISIAMIKNSNTSMKVLKELKGNTTFKLISSSENKDLEDILQDFAKKNNIDLQIDYAGTIEIMDKLNNNKDYDAVWASNSIWLYMLNSDVKITNSKSTSINPVVFGIKKSKAQELGFIDKEVYTKDILEAIQKRQTKI